MDIFRSRVSRRVLSGALLGCIRGVAAGGVPDLALETNSGRIRLAKWRDRMVLVNFWATWCGPCRRELPEMQEFAERYQGVAVLGIALDAPGWPVVTPFLRQHRIRFPVALGNARVWQAFGFEKVPAPVPQTLVFAPGGGSVLHARTALSLADLEEIGRRARRGRITLPDAPR